MYPNSAFYQSLKHMISVWVANQLYGTGTIYTSKRILIGFIDFMFKQVKSPFFRFHSTNVILKTAFLKYCHLFMLILLNVGHL